MPKTSSNPSNNQDVLKIEKRVIDLELSLGELKESIQNIDVSMIPGMNEKVDNLENLLMVEQAGILELKKMLETEKPEESKVPEGLEDRLKGIEASIPNLVEKTEFESKLEAMQKDVSSSTAKPSSVEIDSLYDKLNQLEATFSALKSETDDISKDFNNKLQEISLKLTEFKKPGIDLDLLCTRIDSSKKNIEDLSKKKIELELKISEISNKMELLEDKFGRSPKQELVDGLKLNRKEIVATNSRIDSLERVARELMGDVQNVEKNVRKFESIEKISSLSKNIEDKLERMQFIEEEVKRLTSKIELIYDEIDKKIGKIRLMEKDYSSDITTISETVETHKNQIQNISRLQIGELKNKFEALKSSLINVNDKIVFLESEQDDLNKKIGQKKESDNIIKSVEDIKLEILKEKEVIINLSKEIIKNKLEIEELHKETQNKMTPFIENASKRVESVEGMKLSLEKRIREMPNVLQAMVDLELSPMKNKSDYLERKVKEMKVDELKKILTDVTTEIAVINSKISSMELEQKSKIEEFGLSIKEKISEIRAPALLDDHIKELVNKIVFLESRIMGIEGMIQERSKNTQIMPIIIE